MFALWCVFGAIALMVSLFGAVCAILAPALGTAVLIRDLLASRHPARAARPRRLSGSNPAVWPYA